MTTRGSAGASGTTGSPIGATSVSTKTASARLAPDATAVAHARSSGSTVRPGDRACRCRRLATGALAAGLAAGATHAPAAAQEAERGGAITVTATRTAADPFDVPASIDRVDGADIRDGRLGVNLSESLGVVPGLSLANRQNYAQDLQLSIRGFGARSTFGIRGVRVYVDDIPATQPDGQGQLTNIDLGSVDRIEVLRGPFSALYGNSSGGVLQAFTERGDGPVRIAPSYAIGTDATSRIGLKATGTVAGVDTVVSGSHFETDGPRPHSAARRDLGNAKLVFRADDGTTVTLVVNSVDLPMAQDPLGLSRVQFDRDPRGVDASALQFDTRKSFAQNQAGVVAERAFGDADRLRLLVYGGERAAQQFQAIPVASQVPATSPGGVIDLDRRYAGVDLRDMHRATVFDRPLDVVAGIATDRLGEHRRGYENFIGPPAARVLGVQGALRRDEDNTVRDVDEYLQASLHATPDWTLDAGVRHSTVRFASADRYVVTTAAGTNPDDSGGTHDAATLPVAGLLFAPSPVVHLYATAGRGFETPTLNELAYRPSGATGLNFALRPARSTSVEAGIKTRVAASERDELRADVAVYETSTHDEIVTLSNVGGRATFTNAGRTRRRGVEASLDWRFADVWHLAAAYTAIDARYRDPFTTCEATPCTIPTIVVPAGDRIPGVAARNAYAELAYAPVDGPRGGIEVRTASRVWVDDTNSDAASGYAVLNARVGWRVRVAAVGLEAFARVDNALNRRYAGSVIVNESNGRFFEPSQGRAWLVGVSASLTLD